MGLGFRVWEFRVCEFRAWGFWVWEIRICKFGFRVFRAAWGFGGVRRVWEFRAEGAWGLGFGFRV